MHELNGATFEGEPNSYPSTPGQFAARWNADSHIERSARVKMLVRNSADALRCVTQGHNDELDYLREQLVQSNAIIAAALFQVTGAPELYSRDFVAATLRGETNSDA